MRSNTDARANNPDDSGVDRRGFLKRGFQLSTAALAALTIGDGSASLLASPVRSAAPDPAKATRPNIIFIIADDLGWTDLSGGTTSKGNGSRYYQTPQIDKLAREGMSFTSGYACQNCQPSRASLMTGQYAPHNGVYNVASLDRGVGVPLLHPPAEAIHIRTTAVTVAKTLQLAGYVTAHVGKFHVSPSPEDITKYFGFDYNYGGGVAGDGGPGGYFAITGPKRGWHFRNLGVGMDAYAAPYTADYIAKNLQPFANGNNPATLVGTPKHLTDADADAAIDFIDRHRSGPDKDKQFFLNLAFNAVHVAVRSRPDIATKYRSGKPSSDPRHTHPGYAGLIEGMDQAIGRVVAHLDDPGHDHAGGIANNTLIFFISDNGGFEGSTHNRPLKGGKGMFADGGLRVPLIARYQGVIKAGSITDALTDEIDLYPTVAAFAGATLPDPKVNVLDGVSLAGVLTGRERSATGRTALYWHFPGYLDTRSIPCSVIIKDIDGARSETSKRYKLMYFYEDRHYEMYCLTDDIGEATNLLEGKQPPAGARRDIAQNLRDDLGRWLARVNPSFPTDPKTGALVPPPVPLEQARYGVPNYVGHTKEDTGD